MNPFDPITSDYETRLKDKQKQYNTYKKAIDTRESAWATKDNDWYNAMMSIKDSLSKEIEDLKSKAQSWQQAQQSFWNEVKTIADNATRQQQNNVDSFMANQQSAADATKRWILAEASNRAGLNQWFAANQWSSNSERLASMAVEQGNVAKDVAQVDANLANAQSTATQLSNQAIQQWATLEAGAKQIEAQIEANKQAAWIAATPVKPTINVSDYQKLLDSFIKQKKTVKEKEPLKKETQSSVYK